MRKIGIRLMRSSCCSSRCFCSVEQLSYYDSTKSGTRTLRKISRRRQHGKAKKLRKASEADTKGHGLIAQVRHSPQRRAKGQPNQAVAEVCFASAPWKVTSMMVQ